MCLKSNSTMKKDSWENANVKTFFGRANDRQILPQSSRDRRTSGVSLFIWPLSRTTPPVVRWWRGTTAFSTLLRKDMMHFGHLYWFAGHPTKVQVSYAMRQHFFLTLMKKIVCLRVSTGQSCAGHSAQRTDQCQLKLLPPPGHLKTVINILGRRFKTNNEASFQWKIIRDIWSGRLQIRLWKLELDKTMTIWISHCVM